MAGTIVAANCVGLWMICDAMLEVSPIIHASKRYVLFVPGVGAVALNTKSRLAPAAIVLPATIARTTPPPRGSDLTCRTVQPVCVGAVMFVQRGGM